MCLLSSLDSVRTSSSKGGLKLTTRREKGGFLLYFLALTFLLCRFTSGHGKNHKDAASVRATHPIPAACGIYYFEVKIVSKGRDG